MTSPRLHLIVPPTAPADHTAHCLAAACGAGDVASVLAPGDLIASLLPVAAKHGAALIAADEKGAQSCDGIEVSSREDYDHARKLLGRDKIVGAQCGTSRDLAMALAEAGADYVAFHQSRLRPDEEPIVAWWSALFEIPCIAADPAAPESLAALLTQQPDFIRPPEAMWTSPAEARRIVAELMRAIADAA